MGYSRAVRVGSLVYVSGTTATGEDGNLVGAKTTRTRRRSRPSATWRLRCEVRERGFRTRIYVTNIDRWEEVGRAYGEMFGEVRSTTSMIEVSWLISPEMLVKIKADAVVGEHTPDS